MWKWVVAIILLFLIWRKLYPQTQIVLPQTLTTAGDSFTGCTTVAGVSEPCTGTITIMPHIIFPVDPPPIAIQKSVSAISTPVNTRFGVYRCGVFHQSSVGVGGKYTPLPGMCKTPGITGGDL